VTGNPNAANLFRVTRHLQESAGLAFRLVLVKPQRKQKAPR
jgi:hypothetical protein